MRARSRRSARSQNRKLVDVAPSPLLVRLGGADQWMPRLLEVPGRVAIRRVVAAAHLSALQAHAQVHPPAVDLDALLALERSFRELRHRDRVEMGARRAHAITSPSRPGSGSGSLGSRRSSTPTTMVATAVLFTQLRSAGTTYQGAGSVDVSE